MTTALMALLIASPAAHAWEPPAAPADGTTCTLAGWTNNELAAPIVVRSAPNPRAAKLGTIPLFPKLEHGEDGYSTEMDIAGSAHGYLLIANASDAKNAEPRPVFTGRGWIAADAVRFGIQSAHGYARPDERSERIVDLGDQWATEVGEIDRVLACDRNWVQIDLLLNRSRRNPATILPRAQWTRHRAWFRDACPIEETTCDGGSADK